MSERDTHARERKAVSLPLDVAPGDPQRHEHLTVFPLFATPERALSDLRPLPYRLLVDAITDRTLTIREVGSGTVPTLLAVNRGKEDVLILDGEQLIGAKQNRITNRTIIVATGETAIPVSCMEQGRWHFVSDAFSPRAKARHSPARVRRKAREVEAAYAASPHLAGADVLGEAQGAVWKEIADYGSTLGGESPTGAMDDLYDRHEESLGRWTEHFPLVEGQVGLLAFLGPQPLSLDVVGCGSLYGRLHERFVGGYVMDALATRSAGGPTKPGSVEGPDGADAERFLAAVGSARRGEAPTVGKGTYRLLSGSAIGGQLEDAVDEVARLVHLSAFPGRDVRGGSERGSVYGGPKPRPFAPPSQRRGRWGS